MARCSSNPSCSDRNARRLRSRRRSIEQIAADQSAMPANTVGISQMMRELSSRPGFTEAG